MTKVSMKGLMTNNHVLIVWPTQTLFGHRQSSEQSVLRVTNQLLQTHATTKHMTNSNTAHLLWVHALALHWPLYCHPPNCPPEISLQPLTSLTKKGHLSEFLQIFDVIPTHVPVARAEHGSALVSK